MKYLFFDVECSNCFDKNGKLCEFGYVLTDENFNIIKQDDIPMSPGKGRDCRFHLKGRKHERDLELAYDEEFYYQQPEFPQFYERIKKLMSDENTICFAFSSENDILHLYHTCRRYKLEPIKYYCYDVQRFACQHLNAKKQISLKNACLEIVGPNATVSFIEHLSRDDAKTTMKVFQAICELQQVSSEEYLESHKYLMVSSTGFIESLKQRELQKEMANKGYELFNSVKLNSEEAEKEEYIGRRYNLISRIKKAPPVLEVVLKYVKEHNCVVVDRLSDTDYLIIMSEDDKEPIKDKAAEYFKGEYIIFEDLL